jgi:hypothetical protein
MSAAVTAAAEEKEDEENQYIHWRNLGVSVI